MKKGEMRRDELLATAERLFYTKGYEKTSVQDILTEMNFSKGGFYHHFASKLAVLEAICEMRARENCEQAKGIVSVQEGAIDILTVLVKAELVPSRSEARRAVEQGGVSVNDEKITNLRHSFTADDLKDGILVRRGKKNFKKVVIK